MKKKGNEFRSLRLSFCESARSLPPFRGAKVSTQRRPFTGAVRRVGTWRRLRLPRSITGQRNQRKKTFSISWTRQEPRGFVGSSLILDPTVPGSNSTVENSLFLCHFFLKVRTAKNFKVFHMYDDGLRTCAPVKSIKTAQAGFYRV